LGQPTEVVVALILRFARVSMTISNSKPPFPQTTDQEEGEATTGVEQLTFAKHKSGASSGVRGRRIRLGGDHDRGKDEKLVFAKDRERDAPEDRVHDSVETGSSRSLQFAKNRWRGTGLSR
jgi:hypothetical protein